MGTYARRSSPRIKGSALSVTLALVTSGPAHALQFKNEAGDVTVNVDTTVSAGASWRMQGRDPALVGITNGGTSRSVNEDDGDLNYDKHDLYSTPLKVTVDLELKYKTYGLFARGSYLYDFTYANQDVSPITGFGQSGKDRLSNFGELLDLFAYGSFDVGDRTLNARAGQQLLNWGESTFIPNGINIVNPVDVAKLRTPGSELKEALLPEAMIWASQELSDRYTIEAFYQLQWRSLRFDPRGSYFSSNDYISQDGNQVFVGFGRRNDQHGAPGVFPVNPTAQAWAGRDADRYPSDSGQYGLALRAFVPEWNNVELGLYYVNYHSRAPLVTAVRGGLTTAATIVSGCNIIDVPTFGGVFAATGNAVTATNSACGFAGGRPAYYFVEYPEDIRLWGASFSVPGPAGIAFQGEYSFRPNQPLQVASIELLLAALGLRNNLTGGDAAAFAVPYGTEISGYRRVKMHQVQATATKAFGPTLGANQFAIVGEVGYTYLDLPSGVLFNGPGVFLPAPGSSTATSGGSAQPNGEGYATKSSWGYRLLARMDFENAVGAASLSPRRESDIQPGCQGGDGRADAQLPAAVVGGHRLYGLLGRQDLLGDRPGDTASRAKPGFRVRRQPAQGPRLPLDQRQLLVLA
jgi:hypothetical protein